jgi:hypothetical protein
MKRHVAKYWVGVHHPKRHQRMRDCSQQLTFRRYPYDERLYYCVRDESRSHDSPESVIVCIFTLLRFVLWRHDPNAVVVEGKQ